MTGNTAHHEDGQEAASSMEATMKTFQEYRVELTAIIVLVLAVIGLYSYVQSSSEAAEQAAWGDMFKTIYQSQSMGQENLTNELAKIIDRHRGTTAVGFALQQQTQILFRQEKFPEAEKAARAYLEQYGQNMFAPEMKLSLARILMRQKKYDEAYTVLSALKNQKVSHLEAEISLAMGECLLAQGKAEEAKTAFLTVADNPEYSRAFRSLAEFGQVVVKAKEDAGVTLPKGLAPNVPDLAKPEGEKAAAPESAAPASSGEAATTAQ